MLKRTLCLALTLTVIGCGKPAKPDINSSYDVDNSGQVRVTFKNKGDAPGSVCERVMLTEKAGIGDMREIVLPEWLKQAKRLKDEGQKSGKSLEQIVEANRETLIKIFYFVQDGVMLSDREFCSGLVQAGDVREVNGTLTFAGGAQRGVTAIGGVGQRPFTSVPSTTIDFQLKEKLSNLL